jgi:hypothetical protein
MLAQRPVSGVDQANRERHEEGSQRAEGQRRDTCPGCDVETHICQVDRSGKPRASAYQYHLTRQRIMREPSSRIPAQPWVIGITMRAAMSGPEGKNLTASTGKKAHEIA